MAIVAFIIGGIAGLITAIASGVFLGFGFLAAFGVYMVVSTVLPLGVLMREARKAPSSDELGSVPA